MNIASISIHIGMYVLIYSGTGKSLSESLIFASTNPQYDDRLFIELEVQYMKIPSSEPGENMFCKKKSFSQRFTCTKDINE